MLTLARPTSSPNTMLSILALSLFAVQSAVQEPQPRVVEEVWTELFDGKSLEGWVTRGGRYDGDAVWTVEDGAIVGREGPEGQGGLLYTARQYTSFELELETWIDYPFDSGIFVRMAPEGKGAQVTLDHRPGGQIGAIYADAFLEQNLEGEQHFRKGEWNHLRVRCTGFDFRIEAWLNEKELVDYTLPAGTRGYAPTGLIGLQVHGGGEEAGSKAARFRKVRIRELPIFGEGNFERDSLGLPVVAPEAKARGWSALFNGWSLEGWSAMTSTEGFVIQEGELHFLLAGHGGDLITKKDYRDFSLRLDFNLSRMGNSGVFLRGARDNSNPAYSGCEVQILDHFNWERVTGSKLEPYQLCGGLYGSLGPGEPDMLRPLGEWNTYEILYQGSRLAVALNGRTLYDIDTFELEGPPFKDRVERGFIGLQLYPADHIAGETVVKFRDIMVQEL